MMCPAASQRKPAAKRRGSASKQKYRPTIIGLIHSLWYRYNPGVHVGLRRIRRTADLPACQHPEMRKRQYEMMMSGPSARKVSMRRRWMCLTGTPVVSVSGVACMETVRNLK